MGDFDQGWKEYEWRGKPEKSWSKPPREFVQSRWRGEEPIEGRTILLHAEQGFGDTIQFVRYVPLVAARGARVVLDVQPALKRLLAGIEGAAVLTATGEDLPPFDLHCPLPSLPLAFKTRLETIPAATPYIVASPERIAAWNERLPKSQMPLIGIGWAGNQISPMTTSAQSDWRVLPPCFRSRARNFSVSRKTCAMATRRFCADIPTSFTSATSSTISATPRQSCRSSISSFLPIPRQFISPERWAGQSGFCCSTARIGAGCSIATITPGIRPRGCSGSQPQAIGTR